MKKHQFVECQWPDSPLEIGAVRLRMTTTKPMPWHYGRTAVALVRQAYGTTNLRYAEVASLSWIVLGFVQELEWLGCAMFWFYRARFLELGGRQDGVVVTDSYCDFL